MSDEFKTFFDDYGSTFSQGAAAIAAFYAEPCLTARAGNVRVHPARADLAAFFDGVDRQYRSRGYTHADYELLDLRKLGASSASATVCWSYRGDDGKVIWQTTFTYDLYRRSEGWRILVQIMHDE